MYNRIVKIKSIKIQNIKNVVNGKIDLSVASKTNDDNISTECSNILGIYGQNGSGKTTVVDSFKILKNIMMGKSLNSNTLNNELSEYITAEKEDAKLTTELVISDSKKKYIVEYEVIFSKISDDDNLDKVIVSSEKFQLKKFENGKWKRKTTILYHSLNTLILPKSKAKVISSMSESDIINLKVAEKMTEEKQKSFFFDDKIFKMLMNIFTDDDKYILSELKNYAYTQLFVINNKHNALISMDFILPIAFCENSKNENASGDIPISLDKPTMLDSRSYKLLQIIIEKMDSVMESIIPNLHIKIKEYGTQLDDNGNEIMRFEILSVRNDNAFPIRCESDGIIKIISIINLLINMYNDESFCVVVDELDAGIFEYLLGELLKIIQEDAKGQLIFTSHNLRPLETLDKNKIYFTTTNIENRYIQLAGVKANNNLRDVFLRSINLGYQNEEIYDPTKRSKIRRAFRKAGATYGN